MFEMSDKELLQIIEETAAIQPAGYEYVPFGYIFNVAKKHHGRCNAEVLEFHIRKLDKEGVLSAAYRDKMLVGVNFQKFCSY